MASSCSVPVKISPRSTHTAGRVGPPQTKRAPHAASAASHHPLPLCYLPASSQGEQTPASLGKGPGATWSQRCGARSAGKGWMEMGTQPLWERSPNTCDELCCAQHPLVNTQMGGVAGITTSLSTHSGKSGEEISIHNPGGLNITLSLPRGHPRGCPQLLTLVQGSLVGCGSQALVTSTPSPGTQIWVQSLQGCTAPAQPISCFWEKGLKAPVVVKCSSLPASHG